MFLRAYGRRRNCLRRHSDSLPGVRRRRCYGSSKSPPIWKNWVFTASFTLRLYGILQRKTIQNIENGRKIEFGILESRTRSRRLRKKTDFSDKSGGRFFASIESREKREGQAAADSRKKEAARSSFGRKGRRYGSLSFSQNGKGIRERKAGRFGMVKGSGIPAGSLRERMLCFPCTYREACAYIRQRRDHYEKENCF